MSVLLRVGRAALGLLCSLAFALSAPAQRPIQIQPAALQFDQKIANPSPELIAPPAPEKQSSSRIALADLEQLALLNNPTLAKAHAQVQVAKGQWVQVGLAPNPSVGYSGQQIGSGGLAEQHGVYMTQEIVRGGKLNLNRQAAAHEVARAEQELVAQQMRVLTDVRMAYYRVLIAQRQIDLTAGLCATYRQGLARTQRLFDAKEISRLELLDTQLKTETACVTLQSARYAHAAAWQTLAAVTGQPQLPEQALAGEVAGAPRDFEYHQTLNRLLTASPEIAAAASDIEKARWQLQRALAETKGNVNLQALYNWQDNGIRGRPDGAVIVDMPIPLWNKNQGGIVKAQGEVAIAEQNLQQLELGLKQRLAPVFERYQSARHQVERHHAKILSLAEESVQLARKGYQAGELTYLGLLEAERAYATANGNYLDALRELRLSEVEMEGFLLQNSLEMK
jgi:cobalt-zinc-cadmium efflux system outer membrane protein